MKKGMVLSICLLAIMIGLLIGIKSLYMGKNEEQPQLNYKKEPLKTNKYETEEIDLIILKIAHYFPESHPQHIALGKKFIPIVESGSNWKIRVEVYPNSHLGVEEEYIEGLRSGTIEMCIGGQLLTEIFPKLKIMQLPYIFDDYEQVKKLINEDIGERITEEINSSGIKSLAWNLNGFRQISTYNKSITNINQKEKLKIATTFSDMNIQTIEILGYKPVPLTIDETTMVLKQKVADGHDNPPLLSFYNGWYSNQSDIYITNHAISPAMYMVSSKFWNTLSNEYKELIKKASQESAEYEIKLLEQAETKIYDTLDKKGINIKHLDLTPYKNKALSNYNKFIGNDVEVNNILNDLLIEKERIMKTMDNN